MLAKPQVSEGPGHTYIPVSARCTLIPKKRLFLPSCGHMALESSMTRCPCQPAGLLEVLTWCLVRSPTQVQDAEALGSRWPSPPHDPWPSLCKGLPPCSDTTGLSSPPSTIFSLYHPPLLPKYPAWAEHACHKTFPGLEMVQQRSCPCPSCGHGDKSQAQSTPGRCSTTQPPPRPFHLEKVSKLPILGSNLQSSCLPSSWPHMCQHTRLQVNPKCPPRGSYVTGLAPNPPQ